MIRFFLMALLAVGFSQNLFIGYEALADDSISVYEQVEASLSSLRERSLEVSQRNAWLKKENARLEKDVALLRKQLGVMDRKSSGPTSVVDTATQEYEPLTAIAKRMKRKNLSLSQLESEHQRLQIQLSAREEEGMKLQNGILRLEKETASLENHIQELEGQSPETRFMVKKKKLRSLADQTRKEVASLKREYGLVQRRYQKPRDQMESLQAQHEQLQKRLQILMNESSRLKKDQEILQGIIFSADNTKAQAVINLRADVKELEAKHRMLLQTLAQAQGKLKQGGVDFENVADSLASLRDNFQVLQDENDLLKAEFENLEDQLQSLRQ